MTPFEINYPPGATPLDPDAIAGLIPDYITTQAELNELEQKNIQEAWVWARNRRTSDVLSLGFINELHRRMFGQVWKWAGKARTSGKNIGIDWRQIVTQLAQLVADTRHWVDHQSFSVDEIAVRFHHRLVQIHAFPNGNGRHARLMTDLLLANLGHEAFSWGIKTSKSPIETAGARRQEYITALKAADRNDYTLLLSTLPLGALFTLSANALFLYVPTYGADRLSLISVFQQICAMGAGITILFVCLILNWSVESIERVG